MTSNEQQQYLPAMGQHWLCFLYDPFTRLLGVRRVHHDLIGHAAIGPGQRVLEIGCGTGNLLLAVARRQPGVDALGIDPDPAGLRRARRKAARAGLAVRFEQAYAGALPLPDASVDRVLSSFMLHHLDDAERARALGEVRRVLRPGGQLHVVDAASGHGRLAASRPERVLAELGEAGLSGVTQYGGGKVRLLGRYAFYRAGR